MNRLTAWSLCGSLCALLMAASPGAAQELSADQIVDKNVAARGGLDAWRKLQGMVWTGHIESAQVPSGLPFMLVQQRPNKTRFEIKAQNQLSLRIYDGHQGWVMHPANNGIPQLRPYTAEELGFARDGLGIDGPLIDHQAKGIAVSLDGGDEIEGHKTYRLNVRLPSGSNHHVWVDAQTFLDVKSDREVHTISGQTVTLSMYYRNFKTIDGVKIPMLIESGTDVARISDKMVIDKVLLNPPLDDTVFARPNIPGMSNAVVVEARPQRGSGDQRRMPQGFGRAP